MNKKLTRIRKKFLIVQDGSGRNSLTFSHSIYVYKRSAV